MSPEQKKQWVANRPNVGKIANAEAQKAARPQAWWQNWINSLGRGASSEGLLLGMQGTYGLVSNLDQRNAARIHLQAERRTGEGRLAGKSENLFGQQC
jgi:hypothetical protein